MYNGPVPDMSTFIQLNRNTGKHMYGTVFLYITAIGNLDTTPIAAQRRSRSDVYIFTNNYIAGYNRLWVYKGCRMYHRYKTFEFVYHTL
ncbi:hypothetical protein D9M70_640760 [compost metagenome]